jgi:hypothetical protein
MGKNMEQLDLESDQIKEVYAYFGLAIYQAQCLERQLAILLSTEYGPGPKKMTRDQYDELLQSFFVKTLGSLIKHLRQSVDISDDLESILTEALKKRNWLAHHYFWEKAGQFMTEKGRIQMITELQGIADFFNSIDQQLSEITHKWADRHGITEELLQRHLEELVRNA